MRFLLSWLLVFGVIAGTTLRVMAHEHATGHHDTAPHAASDSSASDAACCTSHDHEEERPAPCAPDCPEKHHHHGTCCIHGVQLSFIADHHFRLTPPRYLSLGCDVLDMRAPDGPVFEMDKPPLI